MPNASSASTSPRARAVPSSITFAVPTRASTSIAVSNGPSSRTTTITIVEPRYCVAPTRAKADTVCPMTRNPRAAAMNKNIGVSATPARTISRRMSGPVTLRATPDFFNMTPSVIRANAPSPWIVRSIRNNLRPSRSV